MVEAVWGRLRHSRRGERREPSATSPIFVVIAGLRWAVAIALLALIGWGLASESRTSYLQSRIFSRFARETSFSVEPGPSETVVFPKWGPYDERLGYTGLAPSCRLTACPDLRRSCAGGPFPGFSPGFISVDKSVVRPSRTRAGAAGAYLLGMQSEREWARAVVRDIARRYLASRRDYVDPFVDRHFSLTG